jgi:hypothetical protein
MNRIRPCLGQQKCQTGDYIVRSNVLDRDCCFSIRRASYLHVSTSLGSGVCRYIVSWTLHGLARRRVLPPGVEPGLLEGRLAISFWKRNRYVNLDVHEDLLCPTWQEMAGPLARIGGRSRMERRGVAAEIIFQPRSRLCGNSTALWETLKRIEFSSTPSVVGPYRQSNVVSLLSCDPIPNDPSF